MQLDEGVVGIMTERILKHKKPADVQFGIKRYLVDKWSYIPDVWKLNINVCLDCGLPTMRLVYQQAKVYTMICMACGRAHRYYARNCGQAKSIYNHIDKDDYKIAKHAVGLDYNSEPTGRNYFTTNVDNPFSTLPNNCYSHNGNSYWITPYGYRLLGFDDMGDDRYLKILW